MIRDQGREHLAEVFREKYGRVPDALARAPGRVNLIGEHIDYNGFAVLPMALDREIVAAFAVREDQTVRIESLDVGGIRSFDLQGSISPYESGDWGNYIKASAQGLVRAFGAAPLRGVDVLIVGDVPLSAGLSSSSALVVLSAVVILHGSGITYPALELASLLAESERYVGTQGGGMDQAVCLLARRGTALRVAFNPLTTMPVALPAGYTFVVANSLKRAAKSEASAYNVRSAECRLATALLGLRCGRPLRLLSDWGSHDGAVDAVRSHLHSEPYGIVELAGVLGDRLSDILRQRDGGLLAEPAAGFELRMRAEHVIGEAARVDEACASLARGDMTRVGQLMDASHASCRDLFGISCVELDRLVEVARGAGALGARLTGAGFGGCTVSLVSDDELPGFLSTVAREYYRRERGMPDEDLSAHLFPARAGDGAGVLS